MKYGQNGTLISTKYLGKQLILNLVFISKKIRALPSFVNVKNIKCKKYNKYIL